MARKIGVDRPPVPEIDELREDNGERLAMERLRYVVLKPGKTHQTSVTMCVFHARMRSDISVKDTCLDDILMGLP